jgi:hypothetical protein
MQKKLQRLEARPEVKAGVEEKPQGIIMNGV